MSHMDFDKLSKRLEALIVRMKQLEHQNAYLKQRESKLLTENARLQQQNEEAQQKIRLALNRLKALEDTYEER